MCKSCQQHNPEKFKNVSDAIKKASDASCPACGVANSEFEMKCKGCGKDLPQYHGSDNPEQFEMPKESQMTKDLLALADHLDAKGLTEEASIVDGLLKEAAKKKKKEKEDDDDKDDKKKGKKGKGFPFWLGKKKKAELLNSLVVLANDLDAKGLTEEVAQVDELVQEVAAAQVVVEPAVAEVVATEPVAIV